MNFASVVYAQTNTINNINGVVTLQGLEGIFQNIISALLALGAIIAFVILLVGGFKYLTSGGDPKAVQSAHLTLTYAIIGFIVVAGSFLILVLIEEFTGARVTVFSVMIR